MKKTALLFLFLGLGLMTFAQGQVKPQWTNVLSDQPETFKTQLVSSTESSIKVNIQVPGFFTTPVTTPRGEASIITVPKSVSTAHAGEPDMPMTGIPLMIGDKARMKARVLDARYMDFKGIEVAPSKGDFSRQIDPATVPYTYGECYDKDAFFPANNLDLYKPYIIRDFRGQNMAVYPFTYNPATKTLRVYYDMTVELYKVDDKGENIIEARRTNEVKMDSDFKNVYQRHFLNYEEGVSKYTPVDEEGDLLVICYDNFISSMTEFVNWKKTRGVNTTIVGTSTSGSTSSAIHTYIQNQYNANNNLTHVLLVGDVAQIPGYTYSGASGYEGKGDNPYGQVVGNDIYNDIFIGRFSATTTEQVTNQVQKILTYERDLTTSDTWCQNGLGVSTGAGSGGHFSEDDYQHIENLRTDLLNYGYTTVYQDYYAVSGFPSSSTTTISNHINSGVGVVNYCNHGSETSWGSHSYSNSHVNALTNDNKLPVIFSVACLNGKYDYSSGDCFAEAWMHATNNSTGVPTGAVGTMMSYISQPWVPPMWAQDEFIDILVESYSNNIKRSWGGTAMNGLFSIFDNYSTTTAMAVGTYQAWVLYGDPTMMLRTKTPQAMTVTHAGNILSTSPTYAVNVNNANGALATITDANHNIVGKATVTNGTANVNISSTLIPGTELTLCVFGYNKVTYLGTINVISPEGPYLMLDSYTPNAAHVGDNTNLSLVFKNIGTSATSGTTTVTLTPSDSNITMLSNNKTFGALAVNATTTVNGFSFKINQGVADGTPLTLHYAAVNGSNTYEGDLTITAGEAMLEYQNLTWDGGFAPGETLTLTAKFKNTGHYQATNAVATISTTNSNYITFANPTITVGNIAVDQVVSCEFNVTIAANCPETAIIPVTFTLTADGGLSAQGSENLKNACNVFFTLNDSYGDGWNGAKLTVSFNDGTASQELTLDSGNSDNYTMEIGNGVHVTLTWTKGTYDSECSFTLSYEDDLMIYQSSGTPSEGKLFEFDCNCAAASQTFTVSVASNGHGTVSGGGEYSYGQSCSVHATPNEGYMFLGWTVNGETVSNLADYTFPVFSNVNLIAVFAEGNQIGSGEATNSFLPSYNYYKYSFTQQIYTSAELGDAGTITSIAFYNGGAEKTRNYDFYLKATNKSSFSSETDWITVSSSDKVFSGSVTMAANEWTFILFSTPFEYDGTSNVVLVADDNTGSWSSSPHMACRVFSATNQAIYAYTDNTNYDPSTPPTSYSTGEYHALISVKNQIQFTKESAVPVTYYNITATADPTAGGSVTGTGSYAEGASVTLTATANTGYTFTKWTKNGTQVTTSTTYTVTVTEDADYVAHFTLNSYNVTATATPSEGGTVSGGGTFNHGTSCTLTATANTGYTFTKWTKNGVQVSTNATYTFNVTEAADYVAVFTINSYNITATANPEQGGIITGAGSYNHGASCTLTAIANDDYLFEGWEENGNILSTEPTLTFTVNNDRTFVAHFNKLIHQTQTFNIGWGWISFYINIEGQQGLQLLEQAFGENGFLIKSQNNGFAQYEDGLWAGSLNSINVEEMYQIKTTGAGSFSLDATPVNPEDHPISVQNGWNWIGYPSTTEATISDALSEFESQEGDMLKSHEAMTTYINGYGWWGTLNKMTPGKGYMYNSKANEISTLVYKSNSRGTQMHTANNDNLHWDVERSAYRDNANVIATIDAKDITLSENLEVGAFINGECRGTTRLLYVEPFDQYMAFLTVYGHDDEQIQFMVYDGNQTYTMDNQITYKTNLIAGNVKQPVVLHQSTNNGVVLYPNPVKAGEMFQIMMPENTGVVTIELIDATGRMVLRSNDVHIVSTDGMVPGVYTIRISDEQGIAKYEKLIIK
jgi:hypothetical protein